MYKNKHHLQVDWIIPGLIGPGLLGWKKKSHHNFLYEYGWRGTDQVESRVFAGLAAWRLGAGQVMDAIQWPVHGAFTAITHFFTFREVWCLVVFLESQLYSDMTFYKRKDQHFWVEKHSNILNLKFIWNFFTWQIKFLKKRFVLQLPKRKINVLEFIIFSFPLWKQGKSRHRKHWTDSVPLGLLFSAVIGDDFFFSWANFP